jgi:L-ribulose-5-phosphate 3-epimerase
LPERTSILALQIGLNGRFFPGFWRPARQEIRFAQQHGFAAIQFPGRPTGLNAEHLGDELETVGGLLAEAELTATMEIVVRLVEDNRTATGQTPLEVLRANLPAITTLPCTCVHWHLVLDWDADEGDAHAVEEALYPQFAEAVAVAEAEGFRFGIEHNEPTVFPFATPAACQAVLAAVPGLHLVWDINHTTLDTLPQFVALVPHMSLIHVADTPLPEVNHHLPLGLGTIDLPAYCRALQAGGFNGPAILEIGGLPRSGGYGRDTDEALVDSLARLRASADGFARPPRHEYRG